MMATSDIKQDINSSLFSHQVHDACSTYESTAKIITGRNEVVAKVIFLHVSVILSTGGGLRQGEPPLAGRPPWAGRPPSPAGRTPPAERPPRQRPPRQGDPLAGRPPLPRRTPRQGDPPGIRSMSGRYASYWNPFLLSKSNQRTKWLKKLKPTPITK